MSDPIAIVGIACRFPGADTPEEYWRLLERNELAVDYVPASRWNWRERYSAGGAVPGTMCCNQGGFIENLEHFDWEFFGLSPAEAARLDPQQKLALEVAWEALESACIVPGTLAGSNTAVIMGVAHSDHARKLKADFPTFDGNVGPDSYECFVANRVSYWLDLKGPSFTVNSACSSSLFALHLAAQSLRAGESDLALSGGVNVHLLADESISSTMAGWLSADSRCKSFREHGDGFVRSEGCGVVVLKRMADARRDGDRIWGVIRGSAIAHNGLSNGISVPNGLSQKELIRRGLAGARVEPWEIDYLEAHGTGSSRGDSNEAIAFMEALSPGRTPERPCAIGCCKPNIGHLEAASGVAGLIKILLCLQHEKLPPIKYLDQLNRWIPPGKPFTFLTSEQAWPARPGQPRLAALSNFGFGGANAFLVVEEPPAGALAASPEEPKFVCFRARTAASLQAMVERFRNAVQPLTDDALYAANAHRTDFRERLAFCAADLPALAACLAGQPRGAVYASDDFAPELYGSRVVLVLAAGAIGADWPAPLERLRSWSVTARVLARWEAGRPQGRIPDDLAGAAAARFMSCFWAYLLRTAGVRPRTVAVGPGLDGAAYVANGVAEPAELEAWIASGAAADLPAPQGRRRARMENVRPLPAQGEVVPRTDERARIFVNPNAARIRVPAGCETLEADDLVDWRQGVMSILLGLFSAGTDIAWERIVSGRKQPIPTYPFDRGYSWFEPSVEIVEKRRNPAVPV